MTWRRAPLATRRPMVRRMVRRMVMTGGGARHAGTWHPAPPCDVACDAPCGAAMRRARQDGRNTMHDGMK
ncbi:hypothetical protein [Novacetimonas pomaceti]|uniref:Uncharacterized protein n=1 Tax=Novacetimonas pomaceti TaxID=2021998 RepID=A0A318QBN6_9PROT|nr:hypothetical protein [Novacetimonas pomaceti]PYD74941.1 hypothetical protein CFR71_11795 [Novacetimonas pomaceti]